MLNNLKKNSITFLVPLDLNNHQALMTNLLHSSISNSLDDKLLEYPLKGVSKEGCICSNKLKLSVPVVSKTSKPKFCAIILINSSEVLSNLLYVTTLANDIPSIYFLTSSNSLP